MNRKLICILLSLITSASLFACDDKSADAGKTDAPATSAVTTEAASSVTDAPSDTVPDDTVLWAASADGEKYGYINEKGDFVIPPKYTYVDSFSENGLACVSFETVFNGTVVRFIDRTGKFAFSRIASNYDYYAYFDKNGLCPAYKDNLYGFIDETGEFAIEPQFDKVYPFAENGLALIVMDERYGFINTKGEIVIEPALDYAYHFSAAGLAIYGVQVGTESIPLDNENETAQPVYKFGYIDETGKIVIEAKFDYADDFNGSGLAPVMIDGKYGYIDKAGNIAVEPQFDEAYPFDEFGFAIVGNHYFTDNSDTADIYGEYGYINTNGEVVIPLEYDDAYEFVGSGIALVAKNGVYYHIRTDGTKLYDTVFEDAYSFSEGLAVVMSDGKHGYIDETGKTVIEPQFDIAYPFDENGYAIVGKYDGEETYTEYEETYTYPAYKYGVIDREGNIAVPMEFESIDF